jgi:hypothetical protein
MIEKQSSTNGNGERSGVCFRQMQTWLAARGWQPRKVLLVSGGAPEHSFESSTVMAGAARPSTIVPGMVASLLASGTGTMAW